jgi:lysophospholipase L1-like esterase
MNAFVPFRQRLNAFGGAFGVAVGFVGSLDAYTADLQTATSISRRLLKSYDGPLIRVVNSGTSAETDIYPADDGWLDETALLAARTGSEVLYVKTIYDQSGLGNDRTIAAEDATKHWVRIVDSSGNIEKIEGRPCGRSIVDLSGPYADAAWATGYTGTTLSAYAVHAIASSDNNNRVLSVVKDNGDDFGTSIAAGLIVRRDSQQNAAILRSNTWVTTASIVYGERSATSSRFDGTDAHLETLYAQGSAANSASWDINRSTFGGQSAAVGVLRTGDRICEAVIWLRDIGETALRSIRQAAHLAFTENSTDWSGKKILWTGTSIPAHTGGGSYQNYPTRLASALGTYVDNQAVGSSRLTWDATKLATTYVGIESLSLGATVAELTAETLDTSNSHEVKVLGKNADWVVFDHSVNDTYQDVGATDSTDAAEFLGALNRVYEAVKTDRPGTKFILLSPWSKYVASSAFVTEIENIVAGMAAWATGKTDVVYIDVLAALDYDATETAALSDGTHPTDAGMQIIADYLETQFLNIEP